MTEASEGVRRPWWRWLTLLLGPAALAGLFAMVGVDAVLAALRQAEGWRVAVALALALPALLVRTLRWKILLGRDGADMSYGEVTAVFAYAMFVGTPTPGRLGELFKIVHLRQRGIPTGRGLASVLLDRLLDVAMLLVVATGALALLAGGADLWVGVGAVGGFLAALLLARALVCGTPGVLLGRVVRPVVPRGIVRRVVELRGGLCQALDELPRRALLSASALTLLGWSVNYFANWQLALALGLPLSIVDVAGVSAVASLVSLLPVSIMGAGTRDVAMVTVLAAYGVSQAGAIALSTLFLVFLIWNALMCGVSVFSRHLRHPHSASQAP